VKPDIVLDAILLRRPRLAGPFPRASPRFSKKAKFIIEKEVARRTRTQNSYKKKYYCSDRPLAGDVTSRSITQPEQKKMFCLKRRAGFAKTKNFFYHPGLDRHGAVDVSGDLDVPRAHVDDEIRAWNLTPHSGVRFSANLPSGIRKSAPRCLGLDFLDSSSSLTSSDPRRFHTLFSPFNHSPFQPLSQSRTDLTSLTKDQKALPRTLSCLL
jgi:hypothetical protein